MWHDAVKGFTCFCGMYHELSAWALAHPTDYLLHACACGRKNKMLGGVIVASGPFNGEPVLDSGETGYVEF